MLKRPLAALSVLFVTASAGLAQPDDWPKADPDQISAWIDALATFGANEDGGIDRVAYSDADIAARDWYRGRLNALGLQNIRIDTAGNIRATRPGRDPALKPIMFGSHIDSVPGGGNYDGQVGSVTALEVVRLLNVADHTTKHPLEVIVFANEEGGVVGSLALAGKLTEAALDASTNFGIPVRDGIIRIGGDPTRIAEARVPTGSLAAFLEVHIEQGAFLHRDGIDIGVVEGIVGIDWYDVTVTGKANHGGTTPMPERTDALVSAAKLVLAVEDIALNTPGRQVATVGRIRAFPGAPNVIPGRVELSLEIRDLDKGKMDAVYAAVRTRAEAIAAEDGTDVTFERIALDTLPAPTDPRMRDRIAEAAAALGLSYRRMPSGAGHDSQEMAGLAPTGMIFVPSVDGISHSPKEFTSAEDIANGADVLLRTILSIDADGLK